MLTRDSLLSVTAWTPRVRHGMPSSLTCGVQILDGTKTGSSGRLRLTTRRKLGAVEIYWKKLNKLCLRALVERLHRILGIVEEDIDETQVNRQAWRRFPGCSRAPELVVDEFGS